MADNDVIPDGLSWAESEVIGGLNEELAQIYAACFGTPAGRAVLADMRKKYVTVTRFVPGAGAEHGFYREGMAQAVFEIEELIKAAKGGL